MLGYDDESLFVMKRVEDFLIIFKKLGFFQGIGFIFCNNLKVEREFCAWFNGKNFVIRSCTNDLYILNSVLSGEEYEGFDSTMLKCHDEDIVIDAGAHIGGSAIKLRMMFPQNRLVLIEPESRNFYLLKRNVSTLKNLTLLNAALVPTELAGQEVYLWNRTGKAGFTIVEGALDNPDATAIQKTTTISIREILANEGKKEIAFLKVDIEGAEKVIFSRDKDLAKNILVAYIELHDRVVEGCTETVRNFFKDSHKEILCPGEKVLYIRQ